MDVSSTPTLSKFGLDTSVLNGAWTALSSKLRSSLDIHFTVLHEASMLDEDVASVFLQNPYSAAGLAKLLLQLNTLGIKYKEILPLVSSHASIASRVSDVLKKIIDFGFKMNAAQVESILSIREIGFFDSLITFFHERDLLNEARLNIFLQDGSRFFGAYMDCVTLLLRSSLFISANENILLGMNGETLGGITQSLAILDHGCGLSQDLFNTLVEGEKEIQAIAEGLEVLQSRVSHFTSDQAKIVLLGAKFAKPIAGSLSFLAGAGLATPENGESLLCMKTYAKAIEIILYQLKRNQKSSEKTLTQENVDRTIALAPWFMEPVLLDSLERIPWSNPLTMGRINALFSELSKLSSDSPEEEKVYALTACADIVNPSGMRGVEMPEGRPQYRMPSV